MIDKKISVSEDVANISRDAQLIFTWSVPHADDVGMLPKSLRTLKAIIIPMIDMTLGDFSDCVDEIVDAGLWVIFEHEGKEYYRIPRFINHQTLKKDRQPQTIIDFDFSQNHKESWVRLYDLVGLVDTGNQAETTGNQMGTEEKRTEEKRREKNTTRSKAAKTLDKKQQALFDAFWAAYPNKKSKKKAHEWWCKNLPNAQTVTDIMAGLERAKTSDQWVKDNGKFIPHPSTWLNGERWTDEVETSSKPKSSKYGDV